MPGRDSIRRVLCDMPAAGSTYAEHLDFNLLACSTAAQYYYHVVTRAWCQHSKLISSTWLSGQTVSPCGPSGFRAIVMN